MIFVNVKFPFTLRKEQVVNILHHSIVGGICVFLLLIF